MWFQVELPQPAMITEVQFDAGAPGGRGVGGGRGGQRGQAAGRQDAAQRLAPAGAGRRRRRRRDAATPPPVFGSFPLGYRVQVSMDGKSWSAPVAEGKGSPGDNGRHVPPGPGALHPGHADRQRRERAAVVGVELPRLRCRQVVGSAVQIRHALNTRNSVAGERFAVRSPRVPRHIAVISRKSDRNCRQPRQ